MKTKKFSNPSCASIDVIDRENRVVTRFHYCPLLSGDYDVARNLAEHFVRDYCKRHHYDVSSYKFLDHYHAVSWSLNS